MITLLWIVLLIFPGIFINAYIFAGVDFDDDTLATVWASAGVASLYLGVFIWAIIAQLLIDKKDISWAALVPFWLLTPLTQSAWFIAYDWVGDKYGYICC